MALTTVSKSGSNGGSTGSKIDEQINKAATPSIIGGGKPAATAPATGDTTKK
jgi:hypothetical protein